MSSIWDWSKVAASNATADSAVNWQEGQLPSTVNGSARQMMARQAEFLGDIGGALTAGGSANVLTVSANSAFTAYADGLILALRGATDNTSAASINVNGIGAKSIRKVTVSGDSALSGAEIQADGIYLLMYSSALNASAGGWQLLNPTMDFSSFVTRTGAETLTNKTLTSPAISTPTITGGSGSGMTLTTATLTTPTLTLKQSATPTPTAEGDIQWDTDDNVLTIGDGAAPKLFLPIPASTAAGDIEYFTGAKVKARLARGTASQALLMNAGATAPAWTTLPFTASFESAQQTITNAGALTLAHGLGVQPKLYIALLQCATAELGYSIGDEIPLSSENSSNKGVSMVADATSINVRFGSTTMSILNKTTGGGNGAFTNANWRLVVRAWA
ncbi:hypothetical protein NKJ46_18450 [Mesorhizobium sp. M0166]|uniref:hypothetical protein n=1 Tax=Mesorhizobium sp. M0166 TaxID=2956902 RepID=UPI00333D0F6D